MISMKNFSKFWVTDFTNPVIAWTNKTIIGLPDSCNHMDSGVLGRKSGKLVGDAVFTSWDCFQRDTEIVKAILKM